MSNTLASTWRRYRALPTVPREIATFALMVLFSLTLLPVAIFVAGQIFLGEYVRDPAGSPAAGFGAFWVDLFRGLASGSVGYWLVLLGPWLVLLALRGMFARGERARR